MAPFADPIADQTRAQTVNQQLFSMTVGLFFIGGFLTAIVSLLVPRFKAIYHLDYAQASLVQVASHLSYLLFAVPITLAIVRLGYMRAIAVGTAIMAAGCIAIATAGSANGFVTVLAALLMLSMGITFLQIAANTVVTLVGPAAQSSARLTLLQAFNSLGTVLGPFLTASLLLSTATTPRGHSLVGLPFAVSAVALLALSLMFLLRRNLLPRPPASTYSGLSRLPALLRDRRLMTGTAVMFAYVGAEVTIGSLLTNYLMQRDIIAATPVAAGRMVSLYWGGAMIGRFAGAIVLRRVSPTGALVATAIAAATLVLFGIAAGGTIGAVALLSVGLCNAIMYPTIYALALPTDTETAPLASMLLCMAVVGGAVVPVLTGAAADVAGLRTALALPLLCYVGIASFAAMCRRSK